MHADRQTDIGIDGRTQTYALMHAGMQSRMHILIMIIIIIKSLFSEDYILSTGTYLKYGPKKHKNHLNIYTNYVHLYKETIGINVWESFV